LKAAYQVLSVTFGITAHFTPERKSKLEITSYLSILWCEVNSSLIAALQSIEDYRSPRGKRYPLWVILLLGFWEH
jgi:hypothetical protein